jgi:hypothetical protein
MFATRTMKGKFSSYILEVGIEEFSIVLTSYECEDYQADNQKNFSKGEPL